jgi:penicillin-binding protein 2
MGRRVFHCWEEGGHGSLPLVNAIERSCDVYFYQLGQAVGLDRMARTARRLGLSGTTGIDLPSEVKGLIPDTDWFNRRYGERGWSTGNVWNLAIGQGEILVTCIQMVRLYAAVANGGFLPVPRLRHHVEDENGELVIPFSPPRGERLRVEPGSLATVRYGLRMVVEGGSGTARGSRLPDFPCAGKTGTVQNPHGAEHGWFCGYAPADDPRIAVALIVEHGRHGSDIAPIFRELVNRHFDLGKAPLRRGPRPESPQ